MLEWGIGHFLFQSTFVLGFGLFWIRRLKLHPGYLLYLSLMPFLLWYKGELWILTVGLALPLLLWHPRVAPLNWLPAIILGVVFVWSWQSGAHPDFPIHIINQLRGEQTDQGGIAAKLLHNKLQLGYFWLKNVEDNLNPVRLYAQGKFPGISAYYLMGYLFPWDIVLHLQALKRWLAALKFNWPVIVWLGMGLFITGLVPNSQAAEMFQIGLLYDLGIISVQQISRFKQSPARWWLAAGGLTLVNVYLIANFLLAV